MILSLWCSIKDLQKAFNTDEYTLLLELLSYCGIRDIANRWFKS